MTDGTSTRIERTPLETLLYYWGVLFRYKWMIISVTTVMTGAAIAFFAVSLSLPPERSPMPNFYTARATIIIQQNTQNDINNSIMAALGITSTGMPRSFDYGSQVMEMMRSRTILDRLIEEFNMASSFETSSKEKLRNALLSRFQFFYSSTTGFLRIGYVAADPVMARDMVNRMISLLDEWYNQKRNTAQLAQQQLLEEKISAVKQDIDTLRNKLKTIPDIDPRYTDYASQLDVQERIFNTLYPQYEAARLAPEVEPVFQVFELAEVPDIKSGPDRKKYTMIVFLGSFLMSAGLALGLNMLKGFMRSQGKA